MPQLYSFLDFEPFDPGEIRGATLLNKALKIPVRRPLMGLEINEETHASLYILYNDLSAGKLINTSSPLGIADGTSNFIITHVTHSRSERIQISESFANVYLHTFGEQPKLLTVRGVLLKAKNFPWKTEWLHNYDANLRASRTIEDAARVYLTIEETIYEGHMLSCEVLDQAETPNMSPLQFVMLLTNVVYGDNLGPAYTIPQEKGAIGTRASSSEYLVNAEGLEQEVIYSLDEFGNLVVDNVNRSSAEELQFKLFVRETVAALTHDIMERMINHPLFSGFVPEVREGRNSDLVNYCTEIAEGLMGNAEFAKNAYNTMSGWVSGEDNGDQAARLGRLSEGSSHGGDSSTSDVDSSELISDEEIGAYAREAS